MTYHNNSFFGLARDDTCLFHGRRYKDWKPPTLRMRKENEKHIKAMEKKLKKETDV